MYKLIIAIFFTVFCLTGNAQSGYAGIAPDWTLTDLDGNSHNLYELLDEGYSVVLDFSATWCGYCWEYHGTHALETLWEEHGPGGTNDVYVFFLESDDNTGQLDLQGLTSNTHGNWITGTSYPILDNAASVAEAYQVNLFPTVISICPSRKMYNIGSVSADALQNITSNYCNVPALSTDASVVNIFSEDYYCSGDNYSPTVMIQNESISGAPMTSATIQTYVNGAEYSSIDWSGSLNLYETDLVDLPVLNGLSGSTEITVTISYPEDMDAVNNSMSTMIEIAPVGQESLIVTIVTDEQGEETSWEVVDLSGNVLYSADNYASLTEYNTTLNLPADGCYEFIIRDDEDNGMCCSEGIGSYTLTDANNNVLAQGGSFERSEEIQFYMEIVASIAEYTTATFEVYPVPAQEILKIDLTDDKADYFVTIYDAVGKIIQQSSINGNAISTIDISTFNQGTYVLHLQSPNKLGSKIIIVD